MDAPEPNPRSDGLEAPDVPEPLEASDASEASEVPGPSDDPESPATDADGHLADVPDGCGCVEVWEHLSGHRS